MPKLITPPKTPTAIEYTQYQKPKETGVYAVRIPSSFQDERLCRDEFLQWNRPTGKWYYLAGGTSPPKEYNGKVVGWIGPLPRLCQDLDIPF